MNQASRPRIFLSIAFLVSLTPILARGLSEEKADLRTLAGETSAAPVAPPSGRVVMLGFDGADARLLGELMAERPDDYPNLRRLASEGTFAPLEVVAPPESPVSWAALNTGQNPAKTGVPGFVRRVLKDGRPPSPGLGHIEITKLPLESFENTPIPTWSPGTMAAVSGAVVALLVFLLALLVLRGRIVPAFVMALLLGGVGAWGGLTVRGYLPSQLPVTKNPNQARNFWSYAADAGVRSVVLDAPQAFDMPAPDGAEVLAGLGLPDARGAIGDWFIYTTDPDEFAREGRRTTTAGRVYRVDEYEGRIETKIYGPENFWLRERLQGEIDAITTELKDPTMSINRSAELSSRQMDFKSQLSQSGETSVDMTVELEGDGARVTIDGQEQLVAEGEWSDFFELSFELNWLLKVNALTRVRLIRLNDPHFELFVNVLDVDPRNPPFWQPLSTPFEFSGELAQGCGLYETYGWPTATMPVKDGEVDPELLMEDVEFTMKWREDLTRWAIERGGWECLMSVFSTTDRVQHMMYRYFDREHPLHDPEAAAREMTFFGERITLAEAIPAIYRQMDRVVGDVLAKLDPADTLLVCSDHGFQTFRRQVNVNNWLAEQGYLAVKPGVTKKQGPALQFVDWANTRAYSLGMGFVYLNLEGREPQGIVAPADADALLAELREAFLGAEDPDQGTSFCRDVYVTEEIHSGPFLHLESDLILGFAPTYRVSWATTSGGLHLVKDDAGAYVPGPVCTDNDSPWSGGHVSVALSAVQGVFFSNKKVAIPEDGAKALHLAPTALNLLGVPVPEAMDLEPLVLMP